MQFLAIEILCASYICRHVPTLSSSCLSQQQTPEYQVPSEILQSKHSIGNLLIRVCATKTIRYQIQERKQHHSPFQRLNSLPRNILPKTQRLNPDFLYLLQRTRFANMRARSFSRTELASSRRSPADFRVVSWAGMSTCSSSEDSCFACLESCLWYEEDELVAWGRHCKGVIWVDLI